MEIRNAIIESTSIGMEGHGIFTTNLTLNYGGSCQGFGGHALDEPVEEDGKFKGRVGNAFGMQLIMEIIKVVGVDTWEDLVGKHVRVKLSDSGWNGRTVAIGHFLEDKWFYPADLAKKHFPEEEE